MCFGSLFTHDAFHPTVVASAVVSASPNARLTDANARALQEAARAHNVELSIYRITRAEEIVATIDKAQASGATALNVFSSPMLDGNVPLIMERVAALRLPAMYQWPVWAERGGFIGYGHPSIIWQTLLPVLRRVFCEARCLPICRSNSRRNSSW
jgi:hypothetical protein